MYEVKDKIFLVTGGAAGIGAGVTKAFLAEGAKYVAVLDFDVVNGQALNTELTTKYGAKKTKFFKCDVTTKDLEDIMDAVYKEQGYIDCVVNCAGILNNGPKSFEKEINVNVTALIRGSLKAYDLMRKDHGNKGGAIINISSIAALFRCNVLPIYSATKSAVLQFTNCLGMEPHYSRSGVRLITICFGVTDTTLVDSSKYAAFDKETDDEQLIKKDLQGLPMQKAESAVIGLLEAYKRGASASTWLISANKSAQDITANVEKGFEILSQGVFDA